MKELITGPMPAMQPLHTVIKRVQTRVLELFNTNIEEKKMRTGVTWSAILLNTDAVC
jgi:hypothetical protein